ncbi:hypothetical protein WH47_08991 [Habropoda laboriosa]|uniref:Uncharacterized protein n=1 Tax=Habropoda laboriosa TaxID=597456 RepID=A0A0L7R6X5_9HYME|nr:hypothetical protein WH47_08991 [Habropoda laboriosa]
MSLSRPVLIKVRTLSICFIIVGLTSTGSTGRGPKWNRERAEHNGATSSSRERRSPSSGFAFSKIQPR